MSKVFYSKDPSKVVDLFTTAGLDKLVVPGEEVALKIHFGEPGNNAYLKPALVNGIRDKVAALGGKPFFTDCNCLYKGPRHLTADHLKVAREHGFDPVRIPEEDDQEAVEVGLKHFKSVNLGGTISRAKTIIALTHFKGHELTGFGGTLKNIGMGSGSRRGKLRMHQECQGCPQVKSCRRNITLEACWVGTPEAVQEKIVEYVLGAVRGKKAGYVTFITDVSPACDCYPHNDPPIVPDLGVLASNDPVAIDQAALDLVNQAAGRDIFKALYPEADYTVQLKYAEQIGLGSRKYELMLS
ncbi:MAG TPA: DUF362 domain-containing protein [Candidatus Sulfotelmatobacter sp.]|nr:DUF362 domain-containing protein [Candidatus Sulfotelmatobacter sp.]